MRTTRGFCRGAASGGSVPPLGPGAAKEVVRGSDVLLPVTGFPSELLLSCREILPLGPLTGNLPIRPLPHLKATEVLCLAGVVDGGRALSVRDIQYLGLSPRPMDNQGGSEQQQHQRNGDGLEKACATRHSIPPACGAARMPYATPAGTETT